jgi:hypothetical protein
MVQDPQDNLTATEAEVTSLRGRTEQVASALWERVVSRRARLTHNIDEAKELFDVRLQFQRHPVLVTGGLALLLGGAGLAIALAIRTRRHEQRWPQRLARRARAYRTILAEPERALRPRQPLGKQLLSTALLALAGVGARAAGERLMLPARRAR